MRPADERLARVAELTKRLLRVSRVEIVLAAGGPWGAGALETSPPDGLLAGVPSAALVPAAAGPLVVADTLEDARFARHPMVTGKPHVRFYAAQPLRLPDGRRAGTLCAWDTSPRRPGEVDLGTLRVLAEWAQAELRIGALEEGRDAIVRERDELRRRSQLDSLTGTWNREAILGLLERERVRAARDGEVLSVVMADVDRFKEINDSYGHAAGDRALGAVAACLRATVRPYDAVGRFGGEEFLAVLPRCDGSPARTIAERMRRRVSAERVPAPPAVLHVTLSLGVATCRPTAGTDAGRLIEAADRALYRAKAEGRDRVAIAA